MYDGIERTLLIREADSQNRLMRAEGYLYDDRGRRSHSVNEEGKITKYKLGFVKQIMKKRVTCFLFLSFGLVMCIFGNGIGEVHGNIEIMPDTQRYRELEKQYPNIKAAPISFPCIYYDFVYIDSDTIIIVEPIQLIEINLLTKEQKAIELSEEWKEKKMKNLKICTMTV